MTPDIEFSVVSGSNEEMLLGCLESLHSTMHRSPYNWSVTITCNGTIPGLANRLQSAYRTANIIDNAAPKGFAENHNVVLRASTAQYVWLLNDDLVMLPDAVTKITEFMEKPQNARVAVVSPRLLNPDGSLQPSTYSFPSMPQILVAHSGLRDLPVTERVLERVAPIMRPREGSSRYWLHDKTIEVETLRGACVAVRMAAVRKTGVMVEVARVGGEETEWHRRFRDAGWKVVYFADAAVIHYGSQTVAGGSANHYPEYLKGALYFFRTGSGAVKYRLFCAALLGMFGTQAAFKRLTGDRSGFELSRRYARVALDGLSARRESALRNQA